MEPVETGTIERMATYLRTWESGDRRRIFLDCYSRMTRNMLAGIKEDRFEDAEWVTGLLHHFADYYFDALTGFERSDERVPSVWIHAHLASRNPKTTTLQNLLLGVNAHINFDLVFALSDVLAPEWADADAALREMRYRDHCLVNRIIGETVDEVQDEVVEVYSPSLNVVDTFGGPVDELLASWLISRWREKVWQRAVEMVECCAESDREALRVKVEERAMERARLLLLM
jgi:hypothetical protein